MTNDRIYNLMALVLICREKLTPHGVYVTLEIHPEYEVIWFYEASTTNQYMYATDGVSDYSEYTYTRKHDEDLKQAEAHLRRLLHDCVDG